MSNRLVRDLKDALADMRRRSSGNLKSMRFFAQHWPEGQFDQQPGDQLPWFHGVTLLTQLDNVGGREWYAAQTVQHGWSRTTLTLHPRTSCSSAKAALARETLTQGTVSVRLPRPGH